MTPGGPVAPALPPGRALDLPGRGTTFVRELAGPPGAPTLVLLHGWTVTADLNWFPSYGPLAEHFGVLALDHRGHGRGIRSWRPFRLEDCADDVAAVVEASGHAGERVILVGYSMGGPVAQLTWRRHPGLVGGLVLCATAARFSDMDLADRLFYGSLLGLSVAARLAPEHIRRPVATTIIRRRTDGTELGQWATDELSGNDAAAMLQACSALGGFDSRAWVGTIDVPTAVVVTAEDRVVSPAHQLGLAHAIAGASVHEVRGDHGVCVADPGRFVPVLVEACQSVANRCRDRL